MRCTNHLHSIVLVVLLVFGCIGVHAGEKPSADVPVPMIIVMGNGIKAVGRVPYSKDLTVMMAIGAAGGITDFGNVAVYLIRNGKPTRMDMDVVLKTPSKDVPLKPWDIILVKQGGAD